MQLYRIKRKNVTIGYTRLINGPQRSSYMRTFVIGDIHGSLKALDQCLDRSGFKSDEDQLILLGDLCDGWPETSQVYDRLLSMNHVVFVRGNHDEMMLEWVRDGSFHPAWLANGGLATMESYPDGVPESHSAFLEASLPYYIWKSKLFVHAGILPDKPLNEQEDHTFLWDRSFFKQVLSAAIQGQHDKITTFDEVYIGHCPIHRYELTRPKQGAEVWMMDTGAGWEGWLSLMNVETKEMFLSDKVESFYPSGSGRAG